ncbi:MAG: DNA gyrase inhibitor YacG [Mariprofundus sp.]|nr:DNA gyrase inhibitor YacG [Mariprofundus sp.]
MSTQKQNALLFSCPNCRKKLKRDAEDFPFCSSRCRIIDLGRWASEDYRIAGESVALPEQSYISDITDDASY